MTWLRTIRPFLLAASLGGCAIVPFQGDVDAHVDSLLAEEQYGRAMEVLAHTPQDHPRRAHFKRRLGEVRKLADQYTRRVTSKADALVRKGEWGEALALYREALNRLPRNAKLREQVKTFRTKQSERVEALQLEKLIAEGKWLRTALSLQKSITGVDPDNWFYSSSLESLRDKAADVAERLTERGLAAMEADDLATAGRTLPLAAELKPSPRIQQAEKQLSAAETRQVKHRRETRERARKRKQEREADTLRLSFKKARSAGDLVQARDLLNRLLALAGNDPENRRLGESFHAHLSKVVKEQLNKGRMLYSQGRIQEAMGRWRRVLELDPQHEKAKANLERAERVIERLRELRDKQTVPTADGADD